MAQRPPACFQPPDGFHSPMIPNQNQHQPQGAQSTGNDNGNQGEPFKASLPRDLADWSLSTGTVDPDSLKYRIWLGEVYLNDTRSTARMPESELRERLAALSGMLSVEGLKKAIHDQIGWRE